MRNVHEQEAHAGDQAPAEPQDNQGEVKDRDGVRDEDPRNDTHSGNGRGGEEDKGREDKRGNGTGDK